MLVVFGLAEIVLFGFILFLLAGTFDYRQAWIFLVVFTLSLWIPGIYVMRKNPVALRQRMRSGPAAENRMVQKFVIAGWYLALVAILVVSALDHRFGWSPVPTAIWLIGDVLVAVGVGVTMLVIIQNSY